jgi:PhnB protein
LSITQKKIVMANINPYLTFTDNCEEAFNFYKAAFGGEFQMISRFGDMPGEHMAPGDENKIMHVALPIGKGSILMGSDTGTGWGAITQGNNFSIAIGADSKDEADQLFDALSAGGKVTMPMDIAPWGDYFGMLTDKFGINWMVSQSEPK